METKKSNQKKKESYRFKVGDPNAKAMWGRCRSQTFVDKTKYTRKVKHKNQEGEDV